MTAWAVRGVELPFGDEAGRWWIDASGRVGGEPIPAADPLPGGHFLPGLIDAHAHPAVGAGPADLVALDASAARANLIAWARAGITVVRDVGSPAGVTLQIEPESEMPAVQAAGRFLAPEGRYFPDLLGTPVAEAELVTCALAEIGRGATWVKVIADFPNLLAGIDTEATYRMEAIAQLVEAAHRAGARVAVHSTIPDAGQLVAAGVDSIEHGFGLNEAAINEMAGRETAWTPTIAALLAPLDAPHLPAGRRTRLQEGTDVTGTLPGEVALLAQMGLDPADALAAASVWPRRFLGTVASADIVTYHQDPRDDPDQLARPALSSSAEPGCAEPSNALVRFRVDLDRYAPSAGSCPPPWMCTRRAGAPDYPARGSGGARAGHRRRGYARFRCASSTAARRAP